ncbi:MAG: putative LPS assembly protein LptD, partial [Gemmatimonadota bacterium]
VPVRLVPEPPDTVGVVFPPGEPPLRPPGEREPPGATRAEDAGPMSESAVREQLRELGGYVITEYSGERAVFHADSNELEITGESRLAREGNTLETDSLLVYDGEAGVVCGYGAPVLSGESDPVRSTRVCFDINREVGMAEQARTSFTQGATWYVGGPENRVYVLTDTERSTLYGERAEFTSCDLEQPHYSFRARSLKMIEDEMIVARDVTLRFEDVPVFWLPWMVSSMKRGRRSGLLMPEFGVNDIVRNSEDYNRHLSNLGFYWALSEHVSARGTFEWYSGNWTAVEGALTYYWRRQFLQGSLTTKHYWRQREGEPAGRELTLNTSNSWQPDERTRIQLNANYASSTDFVRRNSFDPNELNRNIRSSASINRSFDWGSMTLGADRRQQLSSGQVDMTLPSLRLSLSPVTLIGSERGFNVTWTGSGNATRKVKEVDEAARPGSRDTETLNSGFNHRLSLGGLSVGQSFDYRRETLGATPAFEEGPDSVALPAETGETLSWSASTGYQLPLWAGTSLSPSVSVSGTRVRNDETRMWNDSLNTGNAEAWIDQPTRISTGASLTTAVYGFWPGFANFSGIRHKLAPSLRWSYSPTPTRTALQDSVFGVRNLREQNRVTLSFSQTFEAKVESDDTAAADTAQNGQNGQDGEPRRLPQAEKITLLAVNTGTPFVYDFVEAREDGRGFLTDRISNSFRSDLLQGFQLSMSHDLFEEGDAPADGGAAPRSLRPYLTNLSASFSLDNDFWLFRALGLSGGDEDARQDTAREDTTAVDTVEQRVGAEADPDQTVGAMVPGEGREPEAGSGGLGQWRAQLSYSLQRSRPAPGSTGDNGTATLQMNISFSPTEHWSVRWSTAYSFTDSEFANHYLTLTRDLHRWQANFDFVKAQNGNFAMQFRVTLQDNPDLKLDYEQQERAESAPGLPSGVGGQ